MMVESVAVALQEEGSCLRALCWARVAGTEWVLSGESFLGRNSNFLPTVRNCNVPHHKKFSSGSQKVQEKCLFINIRTSPFDFKKFSESVT